MQTPVKGFSKLSKEEKLHWLANTHFQDTQTAIDTLKKYWNSDHQLQQLHDEFIENTVTNYYLPLGIAPNFNINGKLYSIPMAIEESSVVAAASKTAKFWGERGGFSTQIIGTTKIGQVHFTYTGDKAAIEAYFNSIKNTLIQEAKSITQNMERRGGGLIDIELRDKTEDLANYYQLHCSFETLDAMGANFINSCLEQFAATFKNKSVTDAALMDGGDLTIIMSILSNYIPECRVKASVSCPVSALSEQGIDAPVFAKKFIQAIQIAKIEPYRAVTHNKGIMNGIDAVVLATGNDFRAVEAGVHAYASRDGVYRSLTQAEIKDGIFTFWIEVPLALGTVGGLTKLHPLVRWSLALLQNPSAKELMQIVAVAGLAQNFAAVKSLVTTGIQKGHMKMHLNNILNQLEATPEEKEKTTLHFASHSISHNEVVRYVEDLRK